MSISAYKCTECKLEGDCPYVGRQLIKKVTLGIQENYTFGRRVSSFGEKSSFTEEWDDKDWEATGASKYSESSNRWNKCCCII